MKHVEPQMREIQDRCRDSGDLRYQKDISYLMMVIRQREYELRELERKCQIKVK